MEEKKETKQENKNNIKEKGKQENGIKISIRRKLTVVFILIIAIPILVLGSGAYFISTSVVKNQFEDLTKSLGNEVNRAIDTYFHGLEESVEYMSSDSNVQSVYLDQDSSTWMLKSFENYIKNYSDVTNIYLGTEKGDMFVYPRAALPAGFDPRKRDWYIEAVKNKKLTWINPYIDTVTKELVISAGVPVYDGPNSTRLLGVLGIDIKLETLSNMLTNIKVGESGYPILFDNQGIILIHKNKDLIGNPSSSPKLLEALKAGNIDFVEYDFNENGVMKKKFATINVLDRLDWRIASSVYLDEISGHTDRLLTSIVIIGGVSLIIALIVAYLFAKPIVKPLKSLTYNMEKIKEGDFTLKADIKTRDEIGFLGESYNIMIDNLSNFIKIIKDVSTEVTGASQNLAATSEETSATSEEVARAVEEIAKGASEQAQDSERGVVLVTNLANKFEELASNSNDMIEAAKEVMDTSISSVKIVDELQNKTELNNEGTNEAERQILDLDEKIKFIGDILQTIVSIAEQTNLLALNASIEAARAGEHGRGFAVVAEEIRKLAFDSRESSDKIEEIIKAIQSGSENTVKVMQSVKKRTEEQTQAVHEVNSAFQNISSSIDKIAEKIELITEYVNDMNRDKDSIVESIENISSVSEETAAASEEVTASMEQQSMAVTEVAEAANKLNELAIRLNNELSRFSI